MKDRGLVTIEVGRAGQHAASVPLEDLTAKLEWLRREGLEEHYVSLEYPGGTDSGRPPLDCRAWGLAPVALQEESARAASRDACTVSVAEPRHWRERIVGSHRGNDRAAAILQNKRGRRMLARLD